MVIFKGLDKIMEGVEVFIFLAVLCLLFLCIGALIGISFGETEQECVRVNFTHYLSISDVLYGEQGKGQCYWMVEEILAGNYGNWTFLDYERTSDVKEWLFTK